MSLKKPKKSASSFVGSFPSIKLNRIIRYASTLERDFLYFLEFHSSVTLYEIQPFTISMTLDDGKVHHYTPDALVIWNKCRYIVEIKPAARKNRPHTLRQVEIGTRWAPENDHVFRLVTDIDMRAGYKLDNLKLVFRYGRLRSYPFYFFQSIQEIFAKSDSIPLCKVAEYLMPQEPNRCKPYLWSLICQPPKFSTS